MKKLSKENQILVKELIEAYANKKGITPTIIKSVLDGLHENKLDKMSEYEAALIICSISNEQYLKTNREIHELFDQMNEIWATRARENGTKLPKTHQRILH